MAIDFEKTDDGEPSRPALPATPVLLIVYMGGSVLAEPRLIPLPSGSLVLGRAVDAMAGVTLDDKRTSRVHAVVQCDPRGQLHVADAGSHNGTFVNGERVTQAALVDGDVLRVGDSLMVVRLLRGPLADSPCSYLVGCSPAAAHVRSTLARVAGSRSSVLLLGETGTGKEVAARFLHERSGRSGPLVSVNCSALPETLAESILFGHARGAFTGAVAQPGFFRAAHKGTLFFDEVGELPPAVQPKLLRVLEERIVYPTGSVTGQQVDVRLLFATNRQLLAAVSAGAFRADLYARISEVVVSLPPLRQRREDIFLLLQYALRDSPPVQLPAALAELLLLHDWPFNVRELVKLAAELTATGDIESIAARLRRIPPSATPPSLEEAEERTPDREQMVGLLRSYHGNIAAIARKLGCPRKYIYRWIEQYKLDLSVYRD
jgi:transcriptional regulator with GAF, ATPase, and Fis domain